MLSFLLKLRTRAQRLFGLSDAHTMLLWSVVVGVAGAFATMAFREAIALLQRAISGESGGGLVEMARRLPWTVRIWLPAAGGLVAGVILLIARRGADRHNHTDYMEAVAIGDGVVPVRLSLWRSLSSLFTIASGGSIGREGPMVQLAALAASLIGRWVHFDPPRLRLLVACGAAAGITAAYSAPIAGAFFVTEIVLGSIAMESFGPVVVSSVVANITMREFGGYRPPYEMPVFPPVTGVEVLLFVALGLLCGAAAPQFLRLLHGETAVLGQHSAGGTVERLNDLRDGGLLVCPRHGSPSDGRDPGPSALRKDERPGRRPRAWNAALAAALPPARVVRSRGTFDRDYGAVTTTSGLWLRV